MKKEKYDKAEKLLFKIKNPNTLSKSQKNYYHCAKGLIAINKKDWEVSYSELNDALNIGLRTKNDTSIVLLNLAKVEFERKNINEAEDYLSKVGKFKLKPLIRSDMEKLKNEINLFKENNN
ncbi:hypothetical protein [Lacinutrix jangbogonensis]|uniref:hypothetical protein n=1 Tax=Lacinutrix jangbogonensis TaxID=1469557 RepID=UPI00053DFF98|nr:hypothetical protein [Lacinutrix jangbogonensis]